MKLSKIIPVANFLIALAVLVLLLQQMRKIPLDYDESIIARLKSGELEGEIGTLSQDIPYTAAGAQYFDEHHFTKLMLSSPDFTVRLNSFGRPTVFVSHPSAYKRLLSVLLLSILSLNGSILVIYLIRKFLHRGTNSSHRIVDAVATRK